MTETILGRPAFLADQNNIRKQVKGKRILITGAAGSIGSEIVYQLIPFEPKQLFLLDQSESGVFHLQQELGSNSYIQFEVADINDPHHLSRLFSEFSPQLVFHAAACKHVALMEQCPYTSIRTNLFGTILLADLAMLSQVEQFIFLSTDKAVNPTSVMGATKLFAELHLQTLPFRQNNGTRFITTRFGNVIGSNGSVVPVFKKQIRKGGPVTITHPAVSRYFISMKEAAQLVLAATYLGKDRDIVTLDMGSPIRIRDLAKQLILSEGFSDYRDIPIQYIGLRPGEKLHEELIAETDDEKPTEYPSVKLIRRTGLSESGINQLLTEIRQSMDSSDNKKMKATLQNAILNYDRHQRNNKQ